MLELKYAWEYNNNTMLFFFSTIKNFLSNYFPFYNQRVSNGVLTTTKQWPEIFVIDCSVKN